MQKLIKITLRSDLCAAVGKHYSAMIDLDTALDEQGIPYIPSRRLKGCMREAAELIGISEIDELFGVMGSNASNSLKIENAFIEDYQNTVNAIRENGINHSEVTDLFCSTRQETSIDSETGTAKDGSLRFIRVVNRTYPDSNAPLVFYARISYEDRFDGQIEKICKAVRNIGYHRNRGLGAVECELIEDTSDFLLPKFVFEEDKNYDLLYTVHLDGDLMLPASDSVHSLDYIPGTSVLGALAAKYQGEDFNDIFLSGNVRFGNLNISDSEGHEFFPSAKFLAKIKAATAPEDKGIKNIAGLCLSDQVGKTYKPLKKGYINPEYGYKEPERKIVYHNNINGNDSGLYMQYCICSDQYFSGRISGSGKYLKKIYPFFESGIINFGRSKTAQYSACSVVKCELKEFANKTFTAKKDSYAAFVLQSDVVLTDENGVYKAELSELKNCIADDLGKDSFIFDEEKSDFTDKTAIGVITVSGYNAKWNLKKPQITALAAGSVVIAKLTKDTELPEYMTIGERQNEGYGRISVINNVNKYSVQQKEATVTKTADSDIIIKKQKEQLLYTATENANKNFGKINAALNSSQIGRLLLMCKEADSEKNFDERIQSIKTDSVREAAARYFSSEKAKENIGDCDWAKLREYLKLYLTVCKYILRKGGK